MFFALRMQELLDLINFTTRAVFPAQLYTTAACSVGAFCIVALFICVSSYGRTHKYGDDNDGDDEYGSL